MSVYLKRLQDFFRYGHPYRKGIYLATFVLLIIASVGTTYSLGRADSSSIQAGLTIVAEILGVLLGAVLVIVVLLIEQGQRAEEHLRSAYPKYRRKIESNIATVEKASKQLIELVKNRKIRLDEPILVDSKGVPFETKYRDVVGNLIGLIVAISNKPFEHHEKILADLGFTEDEQSEYLYGQGVLADYDPAHFLRLVEDALDVNCLVPWCSNDVGDFATDIFQEYSHDGVSQAVSHWVRSRKVLRSGSLVACVTFIVASMALAVVTLFGITEQALATSSMTLTVAVVLAGFFISVLLTLLLTERMFL